MGPGPASIDEQLTRYAFWRAGSVPRPVGVVRPEPEASTVDFVENELLVDPRDGDLVGELVERYGARLHEEPEIPPPPREVGEGQMHVLEDAPPLPLKLTIGNDVGQRSDLDELADALRDVSPGAAVSSPLAGAAAGIVARYADHDRGPHLNILAVTAGALPVEAPSDTNVGPDEPLQQCRILDAWQLLDSVRSFRSLRPVVWVAVIDSGFGLDPNTGTPLAPDLAGSVGFNLVSKDNRPWGVRGTGRTSSGVATPWHGNAVASAAVGIVNDAGVAGSGGTAARAFLLHTNLEQSEVLYGVKCCYAWGLDVLNISLSFTVPWPGSIGSGWEEQFDFADRHGVVVLAGAGNDSTRLPEDQRSYPATRTPGVITVGALGPDGNTQASYSNYGSSVSVWAPGQLTVAADPDTSAPRPAAGTSIAAPVSAGVAAMMKAVNPSLTSSQARQILRDTGDRSGGVGPRLDAFAALWQAMNETMPPDSQEGNEGPSSARPLSQLSPGRFGPAAAGLAATSRTDADWWRLDLPRYTGVQVQVDWYRRLAGLQAEVTADGQPGPQRAAAGLERRPRRTGFDLTGTLPPGSYRIGVRSTGPTAYRLLVSTTPRPLPPDQFEDNDTLDSASTMLLEPPDRMTSSVRRRWGPGTYEATLHMRGDVLDVDHYRFDTAGPGFLEPTVSLFGADFDLAVDLLAADGSTLYTWHVPPGASQRVSLAADRTSYLRVSARQETRYQFTTGMTWREGVPREWEEVQILPQWWVDPPPDRFRDERSWLLDAAQVGREKVISFVTAPGVEVTARSAAGEELTFTPDAAGRLAIDVAALGAGVNLLTARSVDAGGTAFIAQVPPMRLR